MLTGLDPLDQESYGVCQLRPRIHPLGEHYGGGDTSRPFRHRVSAWLRGLYAARAHRERRETCANHGVWRTRDVRWRLPRAQLTSRACLVFTYSHGESRVPLA